MRAAVVFFVGSSRDKMVQTSKALARGIESQGNQVDIVDGDRDVNTKLTIYEYICVGTEAVSVFGGKIPARVQSFLASAGMVSGKRSFAFVLKKAIGAPKALARLMGRMEHEGMYLKYSEVLSSPEHAEEVGKRLHVD
jgi:menaquinone-dependent protoporphyrinogen IX oxidase